MSLKKLDKILQVVKQTGQDATILTTLEMFTHLAFRQSLNICAVKKNYAKSNFIQ